MKEIVYKEPYKQMLDNVDTFIKNFKLKALEDLNELSSFLVFQKEPLVLSTEESMEFLAYRAIQNLCILADNLRDKFLSRECSLNKFEEQIKEYWNEIYKKF